MPCCWFNGDPERFIIELCPRVQLESAFLWKTPIIIVIIQGIIIEQMPIGQHIEAFVNFYTGAVWSTLNYSLIC